jgi:hypothetical protein
MSRHVAAAIGLGALLMAAALTVSAQTTPDAGSELLVVMTDGRVIRGQTQRHATGYLVERNGGRILVPHEQIRCVARNLPDAYRQQRESMIDPTAASLIQLAEWCISYHLYDEAADELRRTLRRDPENDTARRMLARIQDTLLAAPAKSLETPPVGRDGTLTPEVESLGGLSKEAAATFTTRIQPLLMNKCGNASCHGTAAENEFRLHMVRIGSANHRRSAEANLALVMKYVDVHDPPRSPLLDKVRKGHGGTPVTLFGGSQGTAQLKLLSDWVDTVSSARVAEEQRLAKRTSLKNKPKPATVEPAVAAAAEDVQPTVQPAAFSTDAAPAPHLLVSGTNPAADPPPKPIPVPAKRRVDQFAPAAFNEQFGSPQPRAPARAASSPPVP